MLEVIATHGHGDSFPVDYQTIEKIGEGAFSDVLKARDKTTGKLVAMKRFKKRLHK